MRSVMLEQLYNGSAGPVQMPPYETENSKYYPEKADKPEELLDEQSRELLRKTLEMKNAASCAFPYGCFNHGKGIAAWQSFSLSVPASLARRLSAAFAVALPPRNLPLTKNRIRGIRGKGEPRSMLILCI